MLKITPVGGAVIRIFGAALLLLLSARGGGAAELKKLTVGYSTVGPWESDCGWLRRSARSTSTASMRS